MRGRKRKGHKGRWHRAAFHPSLRSVESCPVVGIADTSETTSQTFASLGLRARLTFAAGASQALTAELALLARRRPTGASTGATADVGPLASLLSEHRRSDAAWPRSKGCGCAADEAEASAFDPQLIGRFASLLSLPVMASGLGRRCRPGGRSDASHGFVRGVHPTSLWALSDDVMRPLQMLGHARALDARPSVTTSSCRCCSFRAWGCRRDVLTAPTRRSLPTFAA